MKIPLFLTFVFFLALVHCSDSSSSASLSCFSKRDHKPVVRKQVEPHPSGNFEESPPDVKKGVSYLYNNLKKLPKDKVEKLLIEFHHSDKRPNQKRVIHYPYPEVLKEMEKEEGKNSKTRQNSKTKRK